METRYPPTDDGAVMETEMNAYQFFKANAGFSYRDNETSDQGCSRNARLLAKVERQARDGGFSYQWEIDQCGDSSDWSDETPAWQVWTCAMRNAEGALVASLGGIDFGRDGSPYGNTYKRVVEAELALEGLTNEPQ